MKLVTLDVKNVKKGEMELPKQFAEPLRPDLIKRAVLALRSAQRHRYGSFPEAGKRQHAKISRRRRDYKGSYGHGISRVPRKILSHRGTRFFWVGAVAAGTVKGKRAHPPKSQRIWEEKINKKENRKAIRSAIAATVVKELVQKRGHHIPSAYPFVLDHSFEELSKTKDVVTMLEALGFGDELERASETKIRGGRGKMRGRRTKKKKGILIVVSKDCTAIKAASNIPGVDIVRVNELNAEWLAPGAHPGRVAIWSDTAVERLSKEHLFME